MTEVKCPECQTKMGKNGTKWCGRHQVQKWLCSKCGRQTQTQIEKEGK